MHVKRPILKFCYLLIPITLLTLSGCSGDKNILYSDDAPLTVQINKDNLKILQFTDLHLTYGFDHNDLHTYRLIKKMSEAVQPDLIVFTGDITMSPLSPSLYKQWAKKVDALDIPWTFLFGNHDNGFNGYKKNLDALENANLNNFLFKVGPQLNDGGYGNFAIEIKNNATVIHKLYLLDSKANAPGGGLHDYDSISAEQVSWYSGHASVDQTNNIYSTVYMHIPLIQYDDYQDKSEQFIDGYFKEGVISSQSDDYGFYDAMVQHQVSKGVFVGHDHLNNFSVLTDDDILLAFGLVSGFNAYGLGARGGRIIEVDQAGHLASRLIYEGDLD